jgi:hypothetical protein
VSFSISHALYQIDSYLAVVPPWLQVVLSAYLAIVLAGMGSGRVKERRGLFVAVLLFAIAALLALRALSLLTAMLS